MLRLAAGLSALVAAVAVGTATQFDHAAIWYFDASVEGWTGTPAAPTASGGYLRSTAGANLLSPTGLDVAAGTYGQVRVRIRRVGTPTWLGQLWWSAQGQSWDASRCLAIPEPDFVDNVALLTWTPGWSGQIDQIRADLAATSDATNYYEIDWITIGRPASGASSAELDAERAARISADRALSQDVVAT